MSLLVLLGFVVVIFALWFKGDVTLNGKAGWFSFFFEAKDRRPSAVTRRAIAELEAGKGKKFSSVEALMADLNADD
jgi:hypothetical protein